MEKKPATLKIDAGKPIVIINGNWTLSGLREVPDFKRVLTNFKADRATIDAKDLEGLDSAGAWIVCQIVSLLHKKGQQITFTGFTSEQLSLISLIDNELKQNIYPTEKPPKKLSFLENTGKSTLSFGADFIKFVAFLGETLSRFFGCIRDPRRFQWASFLTVIDTAGFRALPIVALLSFSIGVVLAYQMGQELKIYGANGYIVSMLGIGILQEFGPLITAIIIAGRTSSAFTAEIGSMKINEEIDALQTMGLSPIERLAIPKILALIVVMPLLVFWADIFGLLGGMIVSKNTLGIHYYNFILHLPIVVELDTLLKGLLKAPFFAAIIAGVGCFEGLQVTYSSESVGQQTTKSVVQAIFWIIVTDSIFSIILPWQSIQ